MSQISLFGEAGTAPAPKQKSPKLKPQSATAAKRVRSAVVQKIEIQPEANPDLTPTQWGNCRVCGMEIAISGLDASLCSNPARTCGSSGWVTDSAWLATNPQRGSTGGGQ